MKAVPPAGVSVSVGAATVSRERLAQGVRGPLPVLLSVAETLRLNVPAWVGVPLIVAVVAVVPVTDRPAGRLVTWSRSMAGRRH